jgi:hypothetical protein
MTDAEVQKKLSAVKSKFLRFDVRRREPEPFFVIVTNRHGHQLAQIEHSLAWNQYVLCPYQTTIWSTGCLNDAIAAMKILEKL